MRLILILACFIVFITYVGCSSREACSNNKCSQGKCCLRRRYCQPLAMVNQSCENSIRAGINYIYCPCEEGLKCVITKGITGRCSKSTNEDVTNMTNTTRGIAVQRNTTGQRKYNRTPKIFFHNFYQRTIAKMNDTLSNHLKDIMDRNSATPFSITRKLTSLRIAHLYFNNMKIANYSTSYSSYKSYFMRLMNRILANYNATDAKDELERMIPPFKGANDTVLSRLWSPPLMQYNTTTNISKSQENVTLARGTTWQRIKYRNYGRISFQSSNLTVDEKDGSQTEETNTLLRRILNALLDIKDSVRNMARYQD